jgi:transcriptional regulator with GAF, ATPase, and Fis domain
MKVTQVKNKVMSAEASFPASIPSSVKSFELVGDSPAFKCVLDTASVVGCRECPVIITGETGTGKEMVARMIHHQSSRSKSVLVPVDCTTLTGQLFESQLFGHVRGAFTGAHSDSLGFFRAADGGTVFLDEVAEIPLELQSKLLRVLQEGMVTPLGSTKSYPVDVRVICATHRDLRRMVDDGKFRQDIFYRLNVVSVDLPPLRDRAGDVVLLARHFLAKQAKLYDESPKVLSPEAAKAITCYNWPGNVRELANCMERAYVLSAAEEIGLDSLPDEIRHSRPDEMRYEHPAAALKDGSAVMTLEEAMIGAIKAAMKESNGVKTLAAEILDVERHRLNRLISKYNIEVACA